MLIRTMLTFAVLFGLTLAAPADDTKPADKKAGEKKIEKGPPADSLLADALAQAKKEHKIVFLQFGSPTCGWCKYLDKYHADAEVRRVLGQHLVIVKVDVVTNPGGDTMYEKYGDQRGVPAFTFLDPDAKVLADSGDKGKNTGFPYEPKEIEDYFKAFKTACPKLSDSEVGLLTKKLKEIGPKK
jgi:thiol:disulfide interchange protein